MVKFRNMKFISANILGKNFEKVVLTHAIPTQKVLFSILKDRKIKTPIDINFNRKYQLLSKHFNIHDCVYFSAGWEYNSTFHHWPFAFIFKPSILREKNFEFFKTFLISQGWMNVLRFWRDNDPNCLFQLSDSSKEARKQINTFLLKDACAFWLFEKELEFFIEKYKHKKLIFEKLDNFRIVKKISNSYSPSYLQKHYFDDDTIRRMEIVSHKSISIDSKYFIGLYINNSILLKILPKIKKYFDKNIIIFDGKKKYNLYDLVC